MFHNAAFEMSYMCTTKYSCFRHGLNEILVLLDVTQRGLIVTDISGQTIGPVFKGQSSQAVLGLFEPVRWTMSINVVK
jgi:hypothetical protein